MAISMAKAPQRATYSVLVLDDDRAVLDTMLGILSLHHEAEGTTRARRALELLAHKSYDVLIVDWQMPDMDGIEFFRRASTLSPAMAGLLITGHMEEFSTEVSREDRRMLGILAKPFAPDLLLDRVDGLGRLASMKKTIRRLREPQE